MVDRPADVTRKLGSVLGCTYRGTCTCRLIVRLVRHASPERPDTSDDGERLGERASMSHKAVSSFALSILVINATIAHIRYVSHTVPVLVFALPLEYKHGGMYLGGVRMWRENVGGVTRSPTHSHGVILSTTRLVAL